MTRLFAFTYTWRQKPNVGTFVYYGMRTEERAIPISYQRVWEYAYIDSIEIIK